jgi:hypothetical protein
MFELINMPELQELQKTASKLEKLKAQKQKQWYMLSGHVQRVRDEDIRREAAALNRGENPPEPEEPEVMAKAETLQRELQVLEQRHQLATQEVSKFVAENVNEIAAKIREAHREKGDEVADIAQQLSLGLSRLWAIEQDFKRLRPYFSQPDTAVAQSPRRSTTSVIMTTNIMQDHIGGVARGHLTQALDALVEMRGPEEEPEPAEEASAKGPVEVDAGIAPVEVVSD